jgi:hypothetical protein
MSEVAELERQLEESKGLRSRRDAAERLSKNKDFRSLIIDGFCTYDAARFVQLSGDPALRPEEREDSLHLAQASGHLKRFLQAQIQMGDVAIRNIPALEEAIAEARAEEGAE